MNRKGAAKAGPVPTSTSTHLPPRGLHINSLWAQPTGSSQGCNWASFKLVIFKNSIPDSYQAILNIPTTEFPPPRAPPYLETNPHPTGLLAPTIDLCLVQQTGVRAQGNSCILKTWTIEICEGSNYLFLCGTVSLGPQTKSGTNREPSKCLEEEWVKQLLPLWLRDIYSPCDSEWQSGEVGLGPEWEGMCSLSATLWVTSGVSIPKGLQGDFRYRDTRKEFLQSWTTWLIW